MLDCQCPYIYDRIVWTQIIHILHSDHSQSTPRCGLQVKRGDYYNSQNWFFNGYGLRKPPYIWKVCKSRREEKKNAELERRRYEEPDDRADSGYSLD